MTAEILLKITNAHACSGIDRNRDSRRIKANHQIRSKSDARIPSPWGKVSKKKNLGDVGESPTDLVTLYAVICKPALTQGALFSLCGLTSSFLHEIAHL